MKELDYRAFVAMKKKPGADIVSAMTPEQADALHMAVGVAGEGGELLDAIKRWTIYQKPLDRDNVVEELGDLEFFMEGLRQRLGIPRDETLHANRVKLDARYREGYTDAEAHDRADKRPAGFSMSAHHDPVIRDEVIDVTAFSDGHVDVAVRGLDDGVPNDDDPTRRGFTPR